jgi:signal transduction histidine kinase/CheY-like chemotaxis protein
MNRKPFPILRWLFLFFILSAPFNALWAQEKGLPFLKNYTKSDFRQDYTFWAALEDDRGVMYFGGADIYEFDGSTWRLIQIPDGTGRVVSLGKDPSGRIYAGCQGDFGFLEADAKGELQYVSLLDQVPREHRNFEEVWQLEVTSEGVYFLTNFKIFRWDGEAMVVLEEGDRFHVMEQVDSTLYVRIFGKGLHTLKDMELELVPGGETLANIRLYSILPYGKDTLILGTRSNGFYLATNKGILPFRMASEEINRLPVYWGIRLRNGNYAYASFSDGVFIVSKSGRLLQHLDRSIGLYDQTATSVYEDRRANLWITTFTSLAYAEINSPFSYYDESTGLPSPTVYSIARLDGIVYAGTNEGIYFLDPKTNRFQRVPGTYGQFFGFEEFQGKLLAAGGFMGLIEVKNRSWTPIRMSVDSDFRLDWVSTSQSNPNRIFVSLGTDGGFGSLVYRKDANSGKEEWIEEGTIINIEAEGVSQDVNGTIWVDGEPLRIARIPEENGLLDYDKIILDTFKVRGKPIEGFASVGTELGGIEPFPDQFIFTEDDYFYYSEALDSLIPDSIFPRETVNYDRLGAPLEIDSEGRLWYNDGGQSYVAVPGPEGSYKFISGPFKRFSERINWRNYPVPQPDGSVVTWFSSPYGLLRYEGDLGEEEVSSSFSATIRGVLVNQDSLVYGGGSKMPEKFGFRSDENNLTFQYASLSYVEAENTEYQTWLEGLDENWSAWSSNPSREYLNLAPGKYTFRVRARDVYQKISEEGVVQFQVFPPWYTRWWAILLYILAAAALVYVIVRWRTRQLEAQSRRLEAEVQNRTKDLRQRNEELSTVNEVSKALAGKLNYNELIQLVGSQMQELFQANIVFVAILDKATQTIHFPFGYGDDLPPIKLGQGLTSQIILSGEPKLINKGVDEVYDKLGIQRLGREAASFLGVPIRSGEEVIGVLSVQSTETTNRFNKDDLNLLSTIASHVGIAMHNAELFEETTAAKAAAEEANEAKGAFLSTVSHELRTPLTSVLGFAKIIKKRLTDRIFPSLPKEDARIQKTVNQISDNLDVVVSEGERLTKLVNDVLDLAKIEAGKVEWNMDAVHMPAILDRAIASTASLFEQKDLHLEKEIANDLPSFSGDEDKLIQVVVNLLSNAVKFTDDGEVTCRAWQEKGEIRVSVSDTGIGIPAEDLESVFEKFKQVGDTLTDKPQGTGLGLPICKEIIEYHHGRIWAESHLGKGSTFFFAIPVHPGEVPNAPKAMKLDDIVSRLRKRFAATHPTNGHERTILVVDDDTPIRSLLNQELSEVGYKVEEASNGKEALEMVREHKPDLILLDVMMPEMNGFDLAAILKNDPETMEIPIIILSIIRDRERGYKIGVDRYMTKPIDTESLLLEIDHLLGQGKSSRKILVVDEEDPAAKTLIEVLQKRGFHVVEANGPEVVEKAIESRPDVIILSSILEGHDQMVKALRFEKGLENVLVLVYQ